LEGVALSTAVKIDASQLKLTDIVSRHIDELVEKGEHKGEWARPFTDSRSVTQAIIDSGTPRPDPGGVPGALRWDLPSAVTHSGPGMWELVVDPQRMLVLHFNFSTKRPR
jgi:hypothetical protein